MLGAIATACACFSLALLATIVFWPLDEGQLSTLRFATWGIVVVFLLQEAVRFVMSGHPIRDLRKHKTEVVLVMLLLVELIFAFLRESSLSLLHQVALQATLVGIVLVRILRRNRFLSHRRFTPGMVLMVSFAALITLGTLLLKSPHATTSGISWIDAAFTATSAVCVTGLIVLNTASDFTYHGQLVILVLIQIGGLGLMTLTYFFANFFAGGVSIRNRIALQDLLSEESLSQVGTVLTVIVVFTLGVEAIGGLLIFQCIGGTSSTIENPVFFSIFHSVSAFCNAGFSTLPGGLADERIEGNLTALSTIMLLIVVGGLGFPVWKNLWSVANYRLKRLSGIGPSPVVRLTTNSRIVIVTTLSLLLGGTVIIYLTEFVFANGERNGAGWFTALFHATTARTAGFNITPTELLSPATAALVMLLMFIGGSPAGTAGGIKTTTVAVAFLSMRRVLFGRREIEAFGRRLPEETADRALAVVLAAIGFTTAITVALCALHPELPPADLAFEAVSAIATVGLSRGVTTELGTTAKVMLILAMFIGRVGVLACLLALVIRREDPGYRLPETNVIIT